MITFTVTGGGSPSADEVAALAVALQALLAQASTSTPSGSAVGGWTVAALREGVGGEPNATPPAPIR